MILNFVFNQNAIIFTVLVDLISTEGVSFAGEAKLKLNFKTSNF